MTYPLSAAANTRLIISCRDSNFWRGACARSELQHLNLEGCQLMTDAAIVALTESPLPLTWLNFSYCLDITDAAVGAVASKCIELVVRIFLLRSCVLVHANSPIFLSRSGSLSFTTITRTSMLQLQTLRMVGLYRISEASVFQFIGSTTLFARLALLLLPRQMLPLCRHKLPATAT